MQTTFKVSIIITAYQGNVRFLREAVLSAIIQHHDKIEIIVVVDNDTAIDQARNAVTGGKRVDGIYTQIKYFQVAEPGGPSVARNLGISMCTGDFVLCLDADDMISHRFIDTCLRNLNESGDIAATGWAEFGFSKKIRQIPDNITYNLLQKGNKIVVSCLFKRDIWVKIGGFDENMTLGFEDWEFWLRATHAGYVIKSINETHFYYRKHEFSHNKRAFQHAIEIKRYLKFKGLI
jgi:glycosyltransferase involved in cell wall biosynthesis